MAGLGRRHAVWVLFVIASLAADVSTQNPNASPQLASGSFQASMLQPSTFTGSMTTAVELALPPARADSTPAISIDYNSDGGNSWVGVGWNIDLGFIQRSTKQGSPMLWSGALSVPGFDDSKGFEFCFRGDLSPLVESAVTPGVFMQRRNTSLIHVERSGDGWIATDRVGTKYWYGTSAQSRQEHPGWTGLASFWRTARWQLERIEDVHGNYTTLEYVLDSNHLYLSRVSYNGHEPTSHAPTHTVDFLNEAAPRPDPFASYSFGFEDLTRLRLDKVEVKVDGVLSNAYDLHHIQSPDTNRSLVEKIVELGKDGVTAAPYDVYSYSQMTTETHANLGSLLPPLEVWPGLYYNAPAGEALDPFVAIKAVGTERNTRTLLIDMDGDALPDRVFRKPEAPYTYFETTRNTGSSFEPVTIWDNVDTQGNANDVAWGSVIREGTTRTKATLLDINGDHLPDRVMKKAGSTQLDHFVVQLNNGLSFDAPIEWGPLLHTEGYNANLPIWHSPQGRVQDEGSTDPETGLKPNAIMTVATLVDMNGDGLPDRVLRPTGEPPYFWWNVQLNTGTGFEPTFRRWGPIHAPGASKSWYAIDSNRTGDSVHKGRGTVQLFDINADGLPDRVMRKQDAPFDYLIVQFNTGSGFTTATAWPGLDNPIYTGKDHRGPFASVAGATRLVHVDLNTDGLPDRLYGATATSGDTLWHWQPNLGLGFESGLRTSFWVNCQSGPLCSYHLHNHPTYAPVAIPTPPLFTEEPTYTWSDLVDLDGDMILDRVLASNGWTTFWGIQKGHGPKADLLRSIKHFAGGTTRIKYKSSAEFDNHDRLDEPNPWQAGARATLPTKKAVVAEVSRYDGMGNRNVVTYDYAGGFWSAEDREFRGFHRVRETDDLGRAVVTWFHQGGGIDSSALGEFEDDGPGGYAKVGSPFLMQSIDTTQSPEQLVKETLVKYESIQLDPAGPATPVATQQTELSYLDGVLRRSTASQMDYDGLARLTWQASLGEVTLDNRTLHAVTDVVPADSMYAHSAYSSLSNPDLLMLVERYWSTDGPLPTDPLLTEGKYVRDQQTGVVHLHRQWLDQPSPGHYVETAVEVDIYGNDWRSTLPEGAVLTYTFDAAHHTFPETITYAGVGRGGAISHVETMQFDVLSGVATQSTDVAGLITHTTLDALHREIETGLTDEAGYQWTTRTTYDLAGNQGPDSLHLLPEADIVAPTSIKSLINDRGSATEGLISITYYDGFARPIQARAEAEGTDSFRVSGQIHDTAGRVIKEIIPFRSTGLAYEAWPQGAAQPGMVTQYDLQDRPVLVMPTESEVGAPTAPESYTYRVGNDPWAMVHTDSMGNDRVLLVDAFTRPYQTIEFDGASTLTSTSEYSRKGDLVQITQPNGATITMTYDSLGRRLSRSDQHHGTLTDEYSDEGHLLSRTDARGAVARREYDSFGRPEVVTSFAPGSMTPESTATYHWDTPVDPSLTVYPGQLAEITDDWGYERASHDLRGRPTLTRRYVADIRRLFDTEFTYDTLDRVEEFTYPQAFCGARAKVKNTYDRAGHLVKVKAMAGTGPVKEVFYEATSFTDRGELSTFTYGNGITTNLWWYESLNLVQSMEAVGAGGAVQSFSYEYNTFGNITKLTDNVYSGASSASISSTTYDGLHRLTSYTRNGAAYDFIYGPNSRLELNEERSLSAYSYPSPQSMAVSAVGSASYAYDASGNMVSRDGQLLEYNALGQLVKVTDGATIVEFGYAADGSRLWREDSTGTTYWIGEHYEFREGRQLCHVQTEDRRVATFEPIPDHFCQGYLPAPPSPEVFSYYHSDHLSSTALTTDRQGAVEQHYVYGMYGSTQYAFDAGFLPPSTQFTNQVLDIETGLYYFGERYLDPVIGRFTAADPAEATLLDSRTLDSYGYANANPLAFIDATGEAASPPAATSSTNPDSLFYGWFAGSLLPGPPPPPPAPLAGWGDVFKKVGGWFSSETLDAIQTGISIAATALSFTGAGAVLSTALDVVNGAVYLLRGKVDEARGSFFAAIPVVGMAARFSKATRLGLAAKRASDFAAKRAKQLRRAIKQVGAYFGPKPARIWEFWARALGKTKSVLENQSRLGHIQDFHTELYTGAKGKGMWAPEHYIWGEVQAALKNASFVRHNVRNGRVRDGYVYLKKVDHFVGWDDKGRRANFVKVVVRGGRVHTAFPVRISPFVQRLFRRGF